VQAGDPEQFVDGNDFDGSTTYPNKKPTMMSGSAPCQPVGRPTSCIPGRRLSQNYLISCNCKNKKYFATRLQ